MNIYHTLEEFHKLSNAIVTSGTFDGVHLGHQKILTRLREIAQTTSGESVVITYWPHPRTVVSEATDLHLLSTIEEKIELLQLQGVQHLLIIPFTRDFSELTSEQFIRQILVDKIGTQKLVIGYDHRFGRNREGSFEHLSQNASLYGFEVEEIPRQDVDHVGVSSSKIRQALLEGNVHIAAEYLGRAYSLTGVVVKGNQLGRTIGYPTANIHVSESYKLIPADGVYAVQVQVNDKIHGGMMNIGMRPTIHGTHRTAEVNIFNFDEDIYGTDITVSFIEKIRNEQKFNGLDALKAQLLQDKQTALQLLKKY
ncbi:bifunctional riboflavin kinase/FAD synthetase [Cytophagaceae bacterium YF14B1]|uniref:Riboflavin biosynthesis protein n=1 Tax=Xanthocytophaga flava TaxID=3048013 RepID=A0AAE3QZH1_9BACT|nr:bifunctional riboflavin kinase/FAD synthetase [Xanthocytophaga flavus]MDJ1485363.1 bifunctional riboflavin kinase/FAD synthetase [Xanthocytophaga flavus]